MIFVHGFSSRHESHQAVFRSFRKKGYKYYAFNLPGHGDNLSQEEAEMRVTRYANLVVEFISRNGLKNIVLVGHSMGGAIAVMVNAAIGERIVCLVLEDPLNKKAFAITLNRIRQTIVGPKSDENDEPIGLLRWIRNVRSRKKEYKKLFRDIVSPATTKNIDSAYQRIGHKPTLLIFGKNDFVVPPKESIAYIAEHAKNLKVCVFEKSGHSPHADEPELYIAQILAFVKENGLRKKRAPR